MITVEVDGATLRALCVRGDKGFAVPPGFDAVALNALGKDEQEIAHLRGGTHRHCADGVLMDAEGNIREFDSRTATLAGSCDKTAPATEATGARTDAGKRQRDDEDPRAAADAAPLAPEAGDAGEDAFCSTFKRLRIHEHSPAALQVPDAGLLSALPPFAHRTLVQVAVGASIPLKAICVGRGKGLLLPNADFDAVACGPLGADEVLIVARIGGCRLICRTAGPLSSLPDALRACIRTDAKGVTVIHRSTSTQGSDETQAPGESLRAWAARGVVLQEHDEAVLVDGTGTLHPLKSDAARRIGYARKTTDKPAPRAPIPPSVRQPPSAARAPDLDEPMPHAAELAGAADAASVCRPAPSHPDSQPLPR